MRNERSGIDTAIETSRLFDRVREFIRRFVVLGRDEATCVGLWAMMTYAIESFDCVPYLMIHSPQKGCGKTLLLEVLELVVARPWLTGRTTPAVLARKIHDLCPALLFDESDATFRGDKEFSETLRGVLNGGYRRSGTYSVCVKKGGAFEYVDFKTFCPKAIAGIGTLPDTVSDRSIPIHLTRRLPTERVDKFRRKYAEPEGSALGEELREWAKVFIKSERVEPPALDNVPDRAADICEPLLAIAEAGGEELDANARDALTRLCGRQREDDSLGVRLLNDIQGIFTATDCERIPSADLASKLEAIEEGPWEGKFGHGLRCARARKVAQAVRDQAANDSR